MKTNLTQIAEVYRAYLGERKIQPRAECPTPEDLIRFVTQGAGRKARAKLMDHVAECADCAQVLQSILRLSGEIDKLTGKGEVIPGCPQEEALKKKKHVRIFMGRRAAVAVLAGLIGLTVITFSVIKLSDRPVVRKTGELRIWLLSPKQGASYRAKDINFKWQAIPQAAGYTVELFNRSMEKVWRSGPISDAGIEPPTEARVTMIAGEAYFWRVTAVLTDGKELNSRLAEFLIKK